MINDNEYVDLSDTEQAAVDDVAEGLAEQELEVPDRPTPEEYGSLPILERHLVRRKEPTLPLYDSGSPELSRQASREFGSGGTYVSSEQPTVWLMVAGEAIAFDYNGEVIATTTFDLNGFPDWDYYAVCDTRGGGGRTGYFALFNALQNAETNARLVLGWSELKRVRT